MKLKEFYSEWLQYDGFTVTVDGKRRRIITRVVGDWITVEAEMLNKRDPEYVEIRRKLGDDWVTDVLDSGPQTEAAYLMACRNAR